MPHASIKRRGAAQKSGEGYWKIQLLGAETKVGTKGGFDGA